MPGDLLMSGDLEGYAQSQYTKLALSAFPKYFELVDSLHRSHTMCEKEGTFGRNAANRVIQYPEVQCIVRVTPSNKSLERTRER